VRHLRVTSAATLSLALTSLAPATVYSAERNDPIETVTVIGVTPLTGALVDRNQVAAPVQTATSGDVERSHALDLTSFMSRRIGSVHVNDVQNNALQPDVNYRGYTASPLLGTPQGLSVYLDGMRLNQPFGDVVSWDLIPREALSSMTLVPGSNPLFGANTLGGALALKTKDGTTDPGYSLAANYGSDQRRRVALEVGGHAASGVHENRLAQRSHRHRTQRLVCRHEPERQWPAGRAAAWSRLRERLHQAGQHS
jgi:outer membrane receptor protein involved in Fe transport